MIEKKSDEQRGRRRWFRKSTIRKESWPQQPRHRAIVAVDIADSTTRTNTSKARLRHTLYEVFENALHTAGIGNIHHDPLIDCGDGILAIIHPAVPKTLLLDTVLPALGEQLTRHDDLRLRAVVHAGEVHYDRRGCFGESLDLSFRLLSAPELKRLLRAAAEPLAVVLSDDIYRTVVRHGYDRIDAGDYAPLVRTQIAGQPHRGWVQLPSPVWGRPDIVGSRTPLPASRWLDWKGQNAN
jgi:class 3 adenylate cyclase